MLAEGGWLSHEHKRRKHGRERELELEPGMVEAWRLNSTHSSRCTGGESGNHGADKLLCFSPVMLIRVTPKISCDVSKTQAGTGYLSLSKTTDGQSSDWVL